MKIRIAGGLGAFLLTLAFFLVSAVSDVPEGFNIVKNGDFSMDKTGVPSIPDVKGSAYWTFLLNGGGAGGAATAAIEDGVLHVSSISDIGNQVYAIQLIQAPIVVEKGVAYQVRFDMKASKPRSVKVKIGGLEGRGWADYTKGTGHGTEFKVDTEMKTYTLDFTMSEDTDVAARFEFQLGLNAADLWIDNVALIAKGKSELTLRTGSLLNGDFADGAKYWDAWSSTESWAGAGEIALAAKDGELAVAVPKVGTVAYNPHVKQMGVSFKKGRSYKVSFYARADKSREIQVNIGKELSVDPFYLAYAPTQVFQLGAAMQPYTFSFTMREEAPDNGMGKIVFEFGTINGKAVPATVTLSSVSIVELDRPTVRFTPTSPGERLANGNFDVDAAGWEGKGAIALDPAGSELYLDLPVAKAAGALVQSGVKLVKGEGYVLSFVASADRALKAQVTLTDAAGKKAYLSAVKAAATLGPAESMYSAYFVMTGASDDKALLSIDFGKNAIAGAAARVRLDRASLRVAGAWMDPAKASADRAKLLLAAMSLDEKVAQMVQSERAAVKEGEIAKYGIGSVLSGGGSVPTPNTPEGWIQMINGFQGEALATRLGIPIIYGVDAVHGHGNVYGATIFPQNIGLGATRDPALVEAIGRATAAEVAATGIGWDFGPCVAVARDERWGRTYESFGESPELQDLLTGPYVRGLQGKPGTAGFMKGASVVATAKHFLGDGGAEYGTGEGAYAIDRGDVTVLTLDELKKIHGRGYVKAVEAGVGAVMASFSMVKGEHMHANKALLTDYLKGPVAKGGLGFKGFVIGDWDAIGLMYDVSGDYAAKVIAAFAAGLDMSMEQSRWLPVMEILKQAVTDKKLPLSRVDDAVARILKVKFDAGLFDRPYALRDKAALLGSAEHKALAARAVKESLVLLKNANAALPLRKGAKLFVTGPLADDVGFQCGGWTIAWQGGGDKGSERLVPGTSILDGLKKRAEEFGGSVVTELSDAKDASVAVVVVGEVPYAEGVGDAAPGQSFGLDDTLSKAAEGNLEAISRAKTLGVPVVVIIVSGRPRIITDDLATWDALVAAWLPGSEGGAVADVLFGLENFKGKLPVTWPSSLESLPVNVGDKDYAAKKPLFAYGFGLTMKLGK